MADQQQIQLLANAIIGLCESAPSLVAQFPPDDPALVLSMLATYARIRECAIAETTNDHLCHPSVPGVLFVRDLPSADRLSGLQACYDALTVPIPSLATLTLATTGIDHLASGQGDHSLAIRKHAGAKGWPHHRRRWDPAAEPTPPSAADLLESCVLLCCGRLRSTTLAPALRSTYEGLLLHAWLDLLNVPHGNLRRFVSENGGAVSTPAPLEPKGGPRRRPPDARDVAWEQVRTCHAVLAKLVHSAADLQRATDAIQHVGDSA